MDFYSLTPEEFELLCYDYSQKLFEHKNYNLEHTNYVHDGGKDIEIKFYDTISNFIVWAECKRHDRNIGLDVIAKNVVLVIANKVHKIIFFSVSDITEEAQITISGISNTFNFEVSYIYGDHLKDEIQKHPDIMEKYFPNEVFSSIPEEKVNFYITLSEHRNSSIQDTYQKASIVLRDGEFIYLYAHIKNKSVENIWNLKVILDYSDSDIIYTKSELMADCLSGKSDLILEFEGRIDNKKVSYIEMPDVILQYTHCKETENYVYETRQLPRLDLSKCKNYPLIGKQVNEFLAVDADKLITNTVEYYPGILDIRGYSGVGKSRAALEIKKILITKGFAVYEFNCKELFDYDLIRSLFCSLLGLPLSKGNIQFSKQDIRTLIDMCGGSEDFTKILSEFLIDNKIEQLDYYYILDALIHFLVNPVCKKPIYIIIDDIQNLSIAVLKFIMRVIDSITKQHSRILFALIANIEAIPNSSKESFNTYLEFMNHKKNACTEQVVLFNCEPLSDPDSVLFLKTLFNLTNKDDEIIKKFMMKSGRTPFEMTMMLEYLNDNHIIHWINASQWYIENPNKMKQFLDDCPKYTATILNKRIKTVELDKEQKRIFRELISSILYFQGCLPFEYLDSLEIDIDFIEHLADGLWISLGNKNGIHFFHDNIYRFFQNKPLYRNNPRVGKKVLQWLETEECGTLQNKEKIIFYCHYTLNNEKEMSEYGDAYLKKCISEMNFSEAVEVGELLYSYKTDDTVYHTTVALNLAYCHLRNGNTTRGNEIFNIEIPVALQYQDELDSSFVLMRIHNGINSFIQSCCCEEALRMLEYMSQLKCLDDVYHIIMLDRYGMCHLYTDHFKQSAYFLQEAQNEAQKYGDDFWISTVHSDWGLYYIYNNELPLAIRKKTVREHLEKAIKFYDINTDQTNYRRASVYLAEIILDILNDLYESAMDKADLGIDECNRIGQHYTLSRIMTMKALAAIYNKNLDSAENILVDCLHMCELSSFYMGRYITYNNLGVIYFLQGEMELAKKYFELSYSLIEDKQFNIRHLSIHANRLLIYKELNDEERYKRVSTTCDKIGNKNLFSYRSRLKRKGNAGNQSLSLWEFQGANFIL